MISSQHLTTFKFSCFHLWPCSPGVYIGQSEAGPAHSRPIRSPETDSMLSPLLCQTSGGPRDSGEGGAGALCHMCTVSPPSTDGGGRQPITGQYSGHVICLDQSESASGRSRRGETEPETPVLPIPVSTAHLTSG